MRIHDHAPSLLRRPERPGFRYHVKVHSFRTLTAILAWLLVVAAFYESPRLLTDAQRLLQDGMEFLGDTIPAPWGPRIEFVFREIGGVIWLQITLLVLALRIVLSGVAAIWRFVVRRYLMVKTGNPSISRTLISYPYK
jgi:hypothetical protein